jgi:hypothetical protein
MILTWLFGSGQPKRFHPALTWVLLLKKKPAISNTDRFFCFNSTVSFLHIAFIRGIFKKYYLEIYPLSTLQCQQYSSHNESTTIKDPSSWSLSWFQAYQSLHLLINTACVRSGEAAYAHFISFGLTPTELEPTVFRLRSEYANNYIRYTQGRYRYQINQHIIMASQKYIEYWSSRR